MPVSQVKAGRPAQRRKSIVRELSHEIASGRMQPGSQLPPRVEIERRFAASPVTVQSALDQLRRDGLIETRGRRGTFVTGNPPHLTRYAIVFPALPDGSGWVRFWTALSNEIIELEGTQTRPEALRLPLYYGIDGHEDSPDYRQLVHEVRSHLVAGLIFTNTPHELKNTPLLQEPNVPRVAIMAQAELEGVPVISLDYQSFRAKALDYLKARGRRRLAILSNPQSQEMWAAWQKSIAQRNLQSEVIWQQTASLQAPESARNLVHLMLHAGQKTRPDALIISDDNLVEHATAGLIAAGLRVPQDVDVVAHCNFPWPAPSALPLQRLGYDARRVVAACVESIDRQRSGKKVPRLTRLPALFEEEIESSF